MTIRCPSCSSPLHPEDVSVHGGVVLCPSCGHGWLEGHAIELRANTARSAPLAADTFSGPDTEIRQIVSASRLAQDAFHLQRRKRRALLTAWASLAISAVIPAVVALTVPEKVVAAAPAMMGFYDWMGHDVNIYGLQIKDVEIRHLVVDGQKIVAVRGELVNISSAERKVPWLRFGLKTLDHKEVYRWTLDTQSWLLRPSEAKSFVTRVASPPETASQVEIRFARADEIGSNAGP